MTLRDRLEKALVRGHENDLDHLLYNERDHIDDLKILRDAAVLIAVTDRPDPGVIFVQRPQHMRNHPGQVAFPGGKIDPGDRDPIDAALREAHEEVALDRSQVDIIGMTDTFQSGSGATPGATVSVTVAGQELTTIVGADGTWTVTPLDPLSGGDNVASITITDPAGEADTVTQTITVIPVGATLDEALGFNPVGPVRLFDTRLGRSADALRDVAKGQISGRDVLEVQLTAIAGYVPGSGVGAVSLNVTSTGSGGAGFITVYPCGGRPDVSSLNFAAGQTVGNAVIAPVSADGTVCFFSSTPTDIVVDMNGWFAEGSAFNPVGPGRVFDTRSGESPNALRDVTKTKLGANTMMEVKLTDLAGFVPGSGVSAVSLNVVATGPDAAGFITVYPCGSRPAVSSVNFATGQTVGNAVIAPVSADGTVCFYSLATSDLVVDINGWFAS